MGLFSSKSNSTTSSVNDNSKTLYDQKKTVDGGSIFADSGSTITINSLDAKLASDALSSGVGALDTAGRTLSDLAYEQARVSLGNADAMAKVSGDAIYTAEVSAKAAAEAAKDAAAIAGGAAADAIAGNSAVSAEAIRAQQATTFDALKFGETTAREAMASVTDTALAGQTTARDALGRMENVNFDSLSAMKGFGAEALKFAGDSQLMTNRLIQSTNEAFTAKLASNAGDAPQQVAQDALQAVKWVAVGGLVLGAAYLFFRK
jgi:hypothetical protein